MDPERCNNFEQSTPSRIEMPGETHLSDAAVRLLAGELAGLRNQFATLTAIGLSGVSGYGEILDDNILDAWSRVC